MTWDPRKPTPKTQEEIEAEKADKEFHADELYDRMKDREKEESSG